MNKKTLLAAAFLLTSFGGAFAASANGFVYSSASGGVKITRYTGSAATLAIPEKLGGKTVVEIGKEAFEDNRTIVELTIPATVKTIREDAFSDMTRLTTVTIAGGSGLRIGEDAFGDCRSLRTVTFLAAPPTFFSTDGDYDDVIFDEVPYTAVGYYPASQAAAWSRVIGRTGRWQGLTMKAATATGDVSVSDGAAVADDTASEDPAFVEGVVELAFYKGFAAAETFALTNLTGGTVTLKRVSGSLPSGLSLKYDKTTGLVRLAGTPTRAGLYNAVYSVTERSGRTSRTGWTTSFTFRVTDPAALETTDADYNATFGRAVSAELPLVTADDGTFAALLKVSVTKAGKISARLTGATKSAVSWSGAWQSLEEGTLSATLLTRKGETLALSVTPEGDVTAAVDGLSTGLALVSSDEAVSLIPAPSYAAYAGTYVAAIEQDGYSKKGTLTLRMNTTAFRTSGTVSYSGRLPNGVSFSGTTTFTPDVGLDEGIPYGELFIYKATTSTTLALRIEIGRDGEIDDADRFTSFYRAANGTWSEIEIDD